MSKKKKVFYIFFLQFYTFILSFIILYKALIRYLLGLFVKESDIHVSKYKTEV